MSISDPLLKLLKAQCQPFLFMEKISDSSKELNPLLETIEAIFHQGALPRSGVIPPPWMWLNSVACEMDRGNINREYSYIRSIEMARESVKVSTNIGKFRLLIRCCLVHKSLHIPVDIMVRQIGDRRLSWYQHDSILGHPVLGEILLSVLLQLSQLTFDLDLRNARFLDLTWQRPQSISTTLVPCSSLGLVMAFLGDLAIVVSVDRSSVAGEDGKIEPGDIFDEFNGYVVTEDLRGKLKTILNKSKNEPVTLSILKTHCCDPEKTYPPISQLYSQSPKVSHLLKKNEIPKQTAAAPRTDTIHNVAYLGSCNVGRKGDVSLVEMAIRRVVGAQSASRNVRIECRELDVVLLLENGETFMKEAYMNIASCGHSGLFPRHFGFIVGNAECSIATSYICHVFLAPTTDVSATILLSLGNGFHRTQCVV